MTDQTPAPASTTALAATDHPGWFKSQALEIDDNLTFDEWSSLDVVQQLAKSGRWWLGDWANYGEFRFGNEFWQGVDSSVIEVGHLTECMVTCAEFPADERREEVSFDHHKVIAYKVKDPARRRQWLDRCASEMLTIATLAKEIKAEEAIDVDEADEPVEPRDPGNFCTARISLRCAIGDEGKAREMIDLAAEQVRAMLAGEGLDVSKVETAVSH